MYPTERKRYIILGAAIGAVFLFFVVVMMLTQLRDGEDYARQAAQGISITQQTSAARGEIVDATGKAFTGNTTICNITIDSNYFTEQELNPLLLTLTAYQHGDSLHLYRGGSRPAGPARQAAIKRGRHPGGCPVLAAGAL